MASYIANLITAILVCGDCYLFYAFCTVSLLHVENQVLFIYRNKVEKNRFSPVENMSIYVIECHVFPACNRFLLHKLVGEAPRSILWRGSCLFTSLTSERLLAACPQPTSYGFSHCRVLPLGTNLIGLRVHKVC